MLNNSPRRRGRPKTHPVDRVRTQTWFHSIKHASKLPSAYAVEMKFDGEKIRKRDTDVARPRKWDSYQSGESVPRDKPGPRNAIEQAESFFPGTSKWFRSPLWDVLKKRKFDQRQTEIALLSLDPKVVGLLFEPEPREGETQPRLLPFDTGSARLLQAMATFDALVAIVLMAQLAEIIASPALRDLAVKTYSKMQKKLRNTPVFRDVSFQLFPLIDAYCKHWTFLSPNQRMDIAFFPENGEGDDAHSQKFRLPGL